MTPLALLLLLPAAAQDEAAVGRAAGAAADPQARGWAALAALARARPAADELGEPPDPVPPEARIPLAAATFFAASAAGDARAAAGLAVLGAGDEAGLWTLVDPNEVRPFPEAWRDWVHDDGPVPPGTLEADAFDKTVAMAHWAAPEALAREARAGLGYLELFRKPAKYRGTLVKLSGRLRRVRRDDDPPRLAQQAGVRYLYEGWLFSDALGANPVCAYFTRLPPGVEVAETTDERVTFAGYYFKRYRYKPADARKGSEWRDAPLLVGQVVAVQPGGAGPEPDEWGKPLLPLFLGVAGLTVVGVAVMTWWFRREDRKVRRRLAALAPHAFDEGRGERGP
jgi:hypothetical protein